MNIVLLQTKLPLEEIDLLLKEFPHYLFLSVTEAALEQLTDEHWAKVEIFFGERLTREQLEKAPQLRWIHTPADNTYDICMEKVAERENILVTTTEEENSARIGEFVMAGVLAFAKNLFHWKEAAAFPNLLWESKWRGSIWSLKKKHFLQIGLCRAGSEIAGAAKEAGMQVYGVLEKRSFHPCCDKTIALKDLHSVLPAADVVSLCLPKERRYNGWFGKEEIRLIKKGALLIVVGSSRAIDQKGLAEVAQKGRFRGILIDASPEAPIAAGSPLWKLPNLIVTPGVADLPHAKEGRAFKTFRFNLRQYLYGNFQDMGTVYHGIG